MNTGRNSKQTACLCRDTGGKGTLPDHFALRPQKLGGLLGTGTGGGGGRRRGEERVKARPRIPSEKDRRDRGPPPEQWKC